MSIKELRESRAKVAKTIRELADKINTEKRDFTADEKAVWEKANADCNALARQIETQERAQALEAELASTAPPLVTGIDGKPVTDEERNLAIQGWAAVPGDGPTAAQRAAAERCGINLSAKELQFRFSPAISGRAYLSSADGTAGGFTIGSTFMPRLEVALKAFGGVLNVAEVINTSTGEEMSWPASDDTSNTGEQIAENAAVTEQAVPFTKFALKSYGYSSKMVRVPFTLLRDSGIDLAGMLGSALGERLGRILNTYFTTGDGAAHPQGIVTGAYLGKTAASATAITKNELVDLVHSVDPAYRQGAQWMFNDGIVSYLRQMDDGEGRPMWQESMVAGQPTMLYGYPVVVNQSMQATVASATKTMLFGQLSRYKVRIVGGIRLKRLEERYAEYDQAAFLAFMSADGGLLNAGQNPVKYMLQA